jgi:uncharacterized protein
MSDTAARTGRDWALGALLLLVATGIVVAILIGGVPLMSSRVVPAMGDKAANAPLVDTVFNVLVFGTMLVVAGVGGLVTRVNPLRLGAKAWAALPGGLVLGLAGIGATVGYAALAGTLAPGTGGETAPALIAWGAGVVLLQTLAEEVYFRGWLQPALAKRWGLWPALAAAAVAFAGLHVAGGARAPMSVVNLLLGGLMFGLLAARGGGIAAALGTHFAWNATEQLGVGLDPNPGTGSFGTLVDRELVGSALWGGSDEGLNASLGMTFALLAIVVPLAILSWRALKAQPAPLPAKAPEAAVAPTPAKRSGFAAA